MRRRHPACGHMLALLAAASFLALLLPWVGCGRAPSQEGGDPFLSSLADRVDVSRMMEVVEYLASEGLGGRPAGSQESAALEDHLSSRLGELGLEPATFLGLTSYRQEFQVPASRCFLEEEVEEDRLITACNLVGMIPGDSQEAVIVTANYDGLGKDPESGAVFPGADYNASGVAALLEVATVLSSLDVRPRKNIVFALLGAEECGPYGSSALAEAVEERGLREAVRVINLEGMGAGEGDYMDVWDLNYRRNRETVRAVEEAAELLGVTLEIGGEDPGSSASTFFLYHIPAVTCDWSWFTRAEHPDFHLPSDTPERMNREGLRKATRVVAVAVWIIAR